MKPVVFPFTQLSESEIDRILSFFDSFVIYSPLEEKGFGRTLELSRNRPEVIITRVPITGDNEFLMKLFNNYRQWADIHKGKAGIAVEQFSAFRDNPPHYSKDSTSHIYSDIQKRMKEPQEAKAETPDVMSRLFLMIVGDYDEKMAIIQRNYRAIDEMEEALMKQIKGESGSAGGKKSTPFSKGGNRGDVGEVKTDERLKFWSYLMLHDPDISGVYVTHSRSVIERVLEEDAGLDPILDTDDMKHDSMGNVTAMAHASFAEALYALSMGDAEVDALFTDTLLSLLKGIPQGLRLTVYWAKDIPPMALFGRFVPDGMPPKERGQISGVSPRHTVIVHIHDHLFSL